MTTKKTVKAAPKGIAKVTRTKLGDDPAAQKTYIYEVESGVMMAPRTRGTEINFPFELMKIGDSFLIPAKDNLSKSPNPIHYAAKQYAKHVKSGFMITTRLLLDKSRRVWRIK